VVDGRPGRDLLEGTVLGTRLTPHVVAALLLPILLSWGCSTSTSITSIWQPTAAEELAGVHARLLQVESRQRDHELWLEALREMLEHEKFKHRPNTLSDAQILELINASLRDVVALETALDHIESDLVAFHVRYPKHQESREIGVQVDSTRKLIRALLNGETLPSMTVAEPPVTCPGTSHWNGRGCTTARISPARPFHR